MNYSQIIQISECIKYMSVESYVLYIEDIYINNKTSFFKNNNNKPFIVFIDKQSYIYKNIQDIFRSGIYYNKEFENKYFIKTYKYRQVVYFQVNILNEM